MSFSDLLIEIAKKKKLKVCLEHLLVRMTLEKINPFLGLKKLIILDQMKNAERSNKKDRKEYFLFK